MPDSFQAAAFLAARFGGEASDVAPLAGMAYQAYTGDWNNLEATARRTLEFAW